MLLACARPRGDVLLQELNYDYVNVFDNTSTDRSFAAQKSGCQIAILYSEVHFEAG